jgi:hypothetical protein
MSQDSAFDDASIPVLTEIVRETPPEPVVAPAAADAAVAEVVIADEPDHRRPRAGGDPISLAEPHSPEAATPAPTLEERAAAQLTSEEWDALELRLCEQILGQLQGRVEFVLQQRLRDSMADVLQHALSGLTEEIRSGLEQTIEQIVSRAVAQELGHLKTLRN